MSNLRELALEASCGNPAAADYLLSVVDALHLWDDLIDRDVEVTDADINRQFAVILTELPRNPFLQAHVSTLTPVLLAAIQNWHVANAVERDEEHDVPHEAAFVLRSSYVDIVMMVATLCGGYDHGVAIGRRVRALAHREGYQQYLKNLADEKSARDGE